jgi:hypothetical protein
MFFIHHVLKFKHEPGRLNVKHILWISKIARYLSCLPSVIQSFHMKQHLWSMYFGSSFISILEYFIVVRAAYVVPLAFCVFGWAVPDVLKDLDTFHQWRGGAMFVQKTRNHLPYYTRLPFVTCISQRSQSGRRTSFRIRVGFIGSTQSSLRLCIYLYLWCNVWAWSVNQIIIMFELKENQWSVHSRTCNLLF